MSADDRGPNDAKSPESRRATRSFRVVPHAPASKPVALSKHTAAKQAVAAAKSSGLESETYGRIHRIVAWLDANKGAFFISRLISQTGQNLRSFNVDTKDDARLLSKLWPMLDTMLSEAERQALMKTLRETG